MMKKIFWFYLVIMGLVMVWYVPPFQKADEVTHFKTASVLVGGRSEMIQKRFVDLVDKLNVSKVAFKSEKRFDSSRLWERDGNKDFVVFGYLTNWKSYISYFPVEIGVWLGSYSPYPVMPLYIGRMAGLILFLICIGLSQIIIPKKYFGLIMAYAIIPMVIHQATEVSYDVFLLCLAPLILSVFFKTSENKYYWKWFVLLSVLIFLFISVKPGYYLMILLLLIVLWNKYKNKIIDRPWIASVAIFALVPIMIYFAKFLGSNVSGVYQFEILKHDPLYLFRIMNETWIAQREFYIKSMLGYFGWLDYQFDTYQYLLIFGVMVAFLVKVISKIKKPVIDWFGWILIGLIILGTYVLIEMGMFMQWTKVGSMVVDGVQGRYLLPLVPLLFFWITQFFVLLGKKKAKIVVFVLVGVILVSGMVDKIYYRYYDVSDNFKNKDELINRLQNADKNNETKTYVSSINKLSINFHIGDSDVVGGFEMVTERKGNMISIPFRYSIKDEDCSRELAWGYLDNAKLNKDNIYLQKFDELKLGYRDICFEIEPIVIDGNEKYFDYVKIEDEPLVRLMFISSEVN